MWDTLQVTHEGTTDVKRYRIKNGMGREVDKLIFYKLLQKIS